MAESIVEIDRDMVEVNGICLYIVLQVGESGGVVNRKVGDESTVGIYGGKLYRRTLTIEICTDIVCGRRDMPVKWSYYRAIRELRLCCCESSFCRFQRSLALFERTASLLTASLLRASDKAS